MKPGILVIFICTFTFYSEFVAQTFTPYPGNPVIQFSQPNPGMWNDPCVIKKNQEYWMYSTSTDGSASPFDGKVLPYLLKSNNGINWTLHSTTPLLTVNPDTSKWDSKGVETPSVIHYNNMYHMYYSAVAVNKPLGVLAIGHATSNDGVLWVKDTIILKPSGLPTDWMSYSVGEPGAVVFQNQVYLYFTGVGTRQDTTFPAGKSVIGLIRSSNGYTFTPPVKVLEQGLNYPAALGFYGYSTPSALVVNGAMHLYYDVAKQTSSWEQVAIHHATSVTGLGSFSEDPIYIFKKEDFLWTQRDMRAPTALLDTTTIKIWFAGDDIFNSTPQWGIGIAYQQNVTTNNVKEKSEEINYSVFPNPTNGSFVVKVNASCAEVIIMNTAGMEVFADKCHGAESNIRIPKLNSGIYFVSIKASSGKVVRQKVIVAD